MSNITARAAYPKILVEDIRTDVDIQISDVNFLWQRFSLGKLNYDLAIPMTAEEVSVCMYVFMYVCMYVCMYVWLQTFSFVISGEDAFCNLTYDDR